MEISENGGLQVPDTNSAQIIITTSPHTVSGGSFVQHGVQELCCVLVNKMRKGPVVELICSEMVSHIRCKHVNYESKREEEHYERQ